MGSRVRVPYAPQNQEADWLPFFCAYVSLTRAPWGQGYSATPHQATQVESRTRRKIRKPIGFLFFVRTCLSPVPLGVMSEVSARGIDVSAVSDGQSTSLAHHVALRGHKLVTID